MCVPKSLPLGVRLVRTTDTFSPESAPAGLLRAHLVAPGVWARLVVRAGRVVFVFEDTPDRSDVVAGNVLVIPPGRLHHVEMPDPDARFAIEFYRVADDVALAPGTESTGLAPR